MPRDPFDAEELFDDRHLEAVLFDMDGTVLSSLPVVLRSWRRLAEEFGAPVDVLGDHSAFHGVAARDIVALLLPDAGPDVQARALARIIELETADTDGVVPLPGAAAALTALAGRSAIVTSSTSGLARVRLAVSGLPLPSVVVTADDVRRGKPDPEPFRLAAARLAAAPERCLVVEDAVAGITAGRVAGAATLGVRTTGQQTGADVVVDDLAQVRFVVDGGRVRVLAA